MNSRTTAARAAITCLLVAGPAFTTSGALAAPDEPAVEAGMTTAGRNALTRAAQKTTEAMLEVRAARVAVFNGALDEGRDLTTLAKQSLEDAQTALHVYRRVEGGGEGEDLRRDWVPFDTSIIGYVDIDSDQEALRALDEASVDLARGKALSAVEAVSEVGGGASITTAYLPVGSSIELLEEARSLIEDERYHDANMALKSVESSVRQSDYTITR